MNKKIKSSVIDKLNVLDELIDDLSMIDKCRTTL